MRNASLAFAVLAFFGADALPRITTRASPGRFVVADSGEQWTPRGLNYIRLNGTQGNDTDVLPVYHATFSERYYNGTAVREAADRACRQLRYNFARVFVDAGSWTRNDGINGDPHGPQQLDAGYVARLADFVSAFGAAGCYTMITLNGLPTNAYWVAQAGPAPPWCEYPQCDMMAPSFVSAWGAFSTAVAVALKAALAGGDTSAILAWSLVNEGFFLDTALPFSSATLNVTTADGVTYSMADTAQRQACADNNSVHWADVCAAAIQSADASNPLVTVGAFTNAAVGKTGFNGVLPVPSSQDPRHPFRPRAFLVQGSPVGYFDLHLYPTGSVVAAAVPMPQWGPKERGAQWSLNTALLTEEWPALDFDIAPVAMCETGSFKDFFATPAAAAAQIAELQVG